MSALPDGLLLAWYGDDFTGAAAVMEVLAFAGLPTLLFLEPPTQEQLARMPDVRCVGVASTARTQSPEWMARELPPAFAALLALRPALLHYKVCSTLDSAPHIGSIGRAVEIGADLLGSDVVPILVAAPQMRRYQAFGHLFAGLGDAVFRLDRHPVMARHPVTPMAESDVARHVAGQSDRIDAGLWSLEDIAADRPPAFTMPAGGRIRLLSLDCTDARTEAACGRLIWEGRRQRAFVAGSQGVQYALVRHWIESGALVPQGAPDAVGLQKTVTVSGSVSPTTAQQIAWSRANGFAVIPFDTVQACGDTLALEREIELAVVAALAAVDAGADPLIHTAEGPDDPAVDLFRAAVAASGRTIAEVNERIGTALGRVLSTVLTRSGLRRAIVSGGDTSGHATRQLGIHALSALAPTIPGAALFLAHADGPMDGLQLALKGGQMGSPDYFGWIRDGGGLR